MTAFDDEHAAQKKLEKKQNTKHHIIELAKTDAVHQLFATREGRLYLRWLIETSGAFGVNAFRGDPYSTAYACGQQSIGHRIMDHMLEVDPVAFANMMKEDVDARRNDTADAGNQPGLDLGEGGGPAAGNGAAEPDARYD